MPLLSDSRVSSSNAAMSREEMSKDPAEVLEEAEQQWMYTEEDLLHTPSILDGMPPDEERQLRSKGTNFITQVGIMLKLPQTTLCTASVFFNRFLMRHSLVKKEGHKPLHHYQIAATALFLATKVEEHTRKLKDLVVACCRVAQKNPNLLVDEQTKDFWLWMDTIKLNEDVLLEILCFDLTIESPYKLLYDFLRQFGLHHNKKLRDAAWAFINDSNMTQLCLLFPSRTIAATALYYAAKMTEIELPEDEQGRSWWDVHKVKLKQVKTALNYMADFYESSPLKASSGNSTYAAARTPIDDDAPDTPSVTRSPLPPTPRPIGNGDSSKRGREEDDNNGVEAGDDKAYRHSLTSTSRVPIHALTGEPSEKRSKIQNGDANSSSTQERIVNGDVQNKEEDEGSEEGELEE